jgi:ppGpp synthetase/RelA/SpoT-type nucleotidyltranferase
MSEEHINKIISFYNKYSVFRLNELLPIIIKHLEFELKKNDIPARVAGRVKNPVSLKEKLLNWSNNPKKKANISSPETTLKLVGDLCAVRVMTYTELDRSKVQNLVEKMFKSPDGIKNFGAEVKEKSDLRIKDDIENHYRATHMQICLKDEHIRKEENKPLTLDSCELQITSMLSHVWNEIEHDTKYKTKTGQLSKEEKLAINSLGLLTQTGDHIIRSLLSARDIRHKKEDDSKQIEDDLFINENELSDFLQNHFGEKIGPAKINYSQGNGSLLKVLEAIDWNHPKDIKTHFSPKILIDARARTNRIKSAQKREGRIKSLIKTDSCDIFFVAICIIDFDKAKMAIEHTQSKHRLSVILKAFVDP